MFQNGRVCVLVCLGCKVFPPRNCTSVLRMSAVCGRPWIVNQQTLERDLAGEGDQALRISCHCPGVAGYETDQWTIFTNFILESRPSGIGNHSCIQCVRCQFLDYRDHLCNLRISRWACHRFPIQVLWRCAVAYIDSGRN
jgi:hypothetical protein